MNISAGMGSNSHQMQTHVAINTSKHTYKQMSDKHAYSTPSRNMHAYTVVQHAYGSAASCQRSLREQNTTCPLIFTTRAESPSNWSCLHLLSLIQGLIAACLLFSIWWSPPSLLFLPKVPSLCLISTHQIPCNYFKSHQGFCERVICIWSLES